MHGFAGYGARGPEMMDYGHGFGLGFIGPILLLILGAVLVAVLIWALTQHRTRAHLANAPSTTTVGSPLTPPPTARVVEDDALRIARERLARGEIDVEQYTVIAEALRG